MCTPKRNGGAGFYSLGNVNLALLTKLAWRLVLDPNALVSKVLFAKYGWWNSYKSLVLASKLGKGFVSGLNYLKRLTVLKNWKG